MAAENAGAPFNPGNGTVRCASQNRFLRTIPIPFQKRIRIVLSERKINEF
jgi:hypothetical protein